MLGVTEDSLQAFRQRGVEAIRAEFDDALRHDAVTVTPHCDRRMSVESALPTWTCKADWRRGRAKP